MMKKMFLMLALGLMTTVAMAQSTRIIKGAVVDKDGNPLPGATVEATNGAESTTVDADGTFSLEVPRWLNTATAKYAGMLNKKMKVQDAEMVFRMIPKTERVWFINAVGGYIMSDPGDDDYGDSPVFGLMGGFLGKWGGYAKVAWAPGNISDDPAVPAITVGATKRMFPFMHAYLGAGFGMVNIDDYHYGSYDDYFIPYSAAGAAFDVGFIFHPFKHITANVGATFITDFDNANYCILAGVGYAF